MCKYCTDVYARCCECVCVFYTESNATYKFKNTDKGFPNIAVTSENWRLCLHRDMILSFMMLYFINKAVLFLCFLCFFFILFAV